MRIAIVEDEPMVARRLERMLHEIVTGCTVEIATTLEAARTIAGKPLDVLFLDLNLKGRDGFRLLEETTGRRFATVVVSAHHHEALRAFEHGVTDFVPKPWTEERLRKAIARVRDREQQPAPQHPPLVVRRGRELRPVATGEIAWIRAADDYAELHLRNGDTHLFERNLSVVERLLPATFIRVHRSYIVNGARVEGLRAAQLRLDDGALIPIGRLFRSRVRRRFGLN